MNCKENMKHLVFILIVFAGLSCITSPNEDRSQQFMHATINGIQWRALTDYIGCSYRPDEPHFYLYGYTFAEHEPQQTITISLDNFTGINTYVLGTSNNFGKYSQQLGPYITEYTTTSKDTGTIVITRLDKTAKIISGTFSFRAAYTDSPLVVTNGAFLAVYNTGP